MVLVGFVVNYISWAQPVDAGRPPGVAGHPLARDARRTAPGGPFGWRGLSEKPLRGRTSNDYLAAGDCRVGPWWPLDSWSFYECYEILVPPRRFRVGPDSQVFQPPGKILEGGELALVGIIVF